MWRRWLTVAVPVWIAGAAQLGQVTVSSPAGSTRAVIGVTGNFNFTQGQLSDRIYFDLPDVHPASMRTERIAVNDAVVKQVRIAPQGSGARIVFDLHRPAQATVSKSASGLTVEIKPAAQTAAAAAHAAPAPAKERARSSRRGNAKKDPAAAPLRAEDLKRVPELPSSFQTRAASPPPAPASTPSHSTPSPAATPPATPHTAWLPESRPEKDFFDDDIEDPIFPAVDEVNVRVSPDVAVYAVEDKALALPATLSKHGGFFAFASSKDAGYAAVMIRAADATKVGTTIGLISLAEYRVFPIPSPAKYPLIEELRRKHGIDSSLNVYAVFPGAFDRVLSDQIRTGSARRGRPGMVVAARIAFSPSAPAGIEVTQVRVRPLPR